jgi:hypothetical protein
MVRLGPGPNRIYESPVLSCDAMTNMIIKRSTTFKIRHSFSYMFNINWDCTCYECECPLYVFCTIKEDDFRRFYRDYTTWAYLNPFTLVYNRGYYKFYGHVIHRVCISCYYFPKRINLQKREIGQKSAKHIQLSKTFQEVYDYFERFQKFRERKDLEICIVEKEKRRVIYGIELCWSPPSSHLNLYI